jgi:hypothetical protein
MVSAGRVDATVTGEAKEWRKFLRFTESYSLVAFPASEDSVLAYVAWIRVQTDKPPTQGGIEAAVRAIRSIHIINGDFSLKDSKRISLALEAVRREIPMRKYGQKEAISEHIAQNIMRSWADPLAPDFKLMWATILAISTAHVLRRLDARLLRVGGEDFDVQKDGSIILRWLKTKTLHQAGVKAVASVSYSALANSPCQLLLRHRKNLFAKFGNDYVGPLFVSVYREGDACRLRKNRKGEPMSNSMYRDWYQRTLYFGGGARDGVIATVNHGEPDWEAEADRKPTWLPAFTLGKGIQRYGSHSSRRTGSDAALDAFPERKVTQHARNKSQSWGGTYSRRLSASEKRGIERTAGAGFRTTKPSLPEGRITSENGVLTFHA